MRNKMHIDAAYFNEDNVLWLVDPDGREVGITPSDGSEDDEYSNKRAFEEWYDAWQKYQGVRSS